MGKHPYLYSFAIVMTTLVLVCALYIAFNGQREARFSSPDVAEALYPAHDGMIELDSGLEMIFDTGSSISLITPRDLAKLKAMGMKVDSVTFPAVGFDTYEKMRLSTKRYKVSLPAYKKHAYVDPETRDIALRRVPGDRTTLDNILFFPAREGEKSTLGMDVLEMFRVERLTPSRVFVIRTDIPEGYQPLADITTRPSWKTLLGVECRYYIDMMVDNETRSFFINSGSKDVVVRMPMEDTTAIRAPRHPSLMQQHEHVLPVQVGTGWMQIGDRAGERMITFADFDDNEEPWSINPSYLFDSDVVFDYIGKKLYIRPANFGG